MAFLSLWLIQVKRVKADIVCCWVVFKYANSVYAQKENVAIMFTWASCFMLTCPGITRHDDMKYVNMTTKIITTHLQTNRDKIIWTCYSHDLILTEASMDPPNVAIMFTWSSCSMLTCRGITRHDDIRSSSFFFAKVSVN